MLESLAYFLRNAEICGSYHAIWHQTNNLHVCKAIMCTVELSRVSGNADPYHTSRNILAVKSQGQIIFIFSYAP